MIQWNIETLFERNLCLQFPHREQPAAKQQLISEHAKWTRHETGDSSYRESVLEGWGLSESRALADSLRKRFRRMVVLGIGGSALGARACWSALHWSVPLAEQRELVIIDNLDPLWWDENVKEENLGETVFAVISKSGGTVETVAQLSDLLARLERHKLSIKNHVIAVTDANQGALRDWVNQEGVTALSLDRRTGGRFSVFSPVGYLPLAFAGLDVSLLREGARQSFCDSLEGPARLALRFAELESQGIRAINVLSYSSWLKEMGAWFVQLWGESLGKQKSAVLATGLIPMSSIGATDQHSLLQYLLDGPNQVLNAIVTIKDWPMKSSLLPRVERVPPAFSKQSFLAGHNFAQILKAEAMASFEALRQSERAVFHVEWTHLDALNVGRWMASWMDLTVLTAAALGVNPFDQPGVEKIKTKIPAALIAT